MLVEVLAAGNDPGGVRHPRDFLPDQPLVRIRLELSPEGPEVPVEDGGEHARRARAGAHELEKTVRTRGPDRMVVPHDANP